MENYYRCNIPTHQNTEMSGEVRCTYYHNKNDKEVKRLFHKFQKVNPTVVVLPNTNNKSRIF